MRPSWFKESWQALPSHRAYLKVANWYWWTFLSLIFGAAFAFLLSRAEPYPDLPLAVYMGGFLPCPFIFAIAVRRLLRMLRLRREEIDRGVFAGAPSGLLFLDRHALLIGAAAICVALAIGIVVTMLRG